MPRRFIFSLVFVLSLLAGPVMVAAVSVDSDGDGLSDEMELKFQTDQDNPDSDEDGYPDGLEVKNGYDPLQGTGAKLFKQIKINLAKQELSYNLGNVELGKFPISAGKSSTPTPRGTFAVMNKNQKAWSASYKLWMPYWLGFKDTTYGIHELPFWPSGRREGESSLGRPASHGCVRLGIGSAKIVYDFAAVGTEVKIE
ncbi:MAG TPA: L,D-transpeptidase [bacterium]|nr:L,D-transpeptidase [bacterium]HPT29740.1 L,D-transpeptidase [bacterium]